MKIKQVVFVTAHPDDESLWVGGTLNFLNKLKGVTPFVICMTGRNDPERFSEFRNAMRVANIKDWVVGDMDIPKNGTIPLNDIQGVFDRSLEELQLNPEDIDLLVTHPFYGDEHEHLQHKQLFNHFFQLDFPFAFFSSMTIPLEMLSIMKDMKRLYNTHLINAAELKNFIATHYLQFKVDEDVKKRMLLQYNSINLEEHLQGYAAWDSYVEGLYFKDSKAFDCFMSFVEQMPTPGGPTLFLR